MQGKSVKDYIIGAQIRILNDMGLHSGKNSRGEPVTIYAINRKTADPPTLNEYESRLYKNVQGTFPKMIEVVPTDNNFYFVFESLLPPTQGSASPLTLLERIQQLYTCTSFKIDQIELFLDRHGKLTHLPSYYRKSISTTRFFAMFHNKSILSMFFIKAVPCTDDKALLDILVKQFDSPDLKTFVKPYLKEISEEYESLEDTQIMKLLDDVRVNQDFQTRASIDYRRSIKVEEVKVEEVKAKASKPVDLKHLMNSVEKSMINSPTFAFKPKIINSQASKKSAETAKVSPPQSTPVVPKQEKPTEYISKDIPTGVPMAVEPAHIPQKSKQIVPANSKKPNDSKKEQTKYSPMGGKREEERQEYINHIQLFCQQFQLLSTFRKSALKYYNNGHTGLLTAYLLTLIGLIRESQLVRDLQTGQDIFNLFIQVSKLDITRVLASLKREMLNEAKLLVVLKERLDKQHLPTETYQKIEQFLDTRIDSVPRGKLESFTFFLLGVLMQQRTESIHFIFAVEVMYLLLHQSYDIVYLTSEMPSNYDQQFFNMRILLIQALVPGWSLN